MSVDLIVYLRRAGMPKASRWAEAIRNAGFPVDFEYDFDSESAAGFRPCTFRGELSGFEYYSSHLSEEERDQRGAPPECDFCVNLVTHSDLRDFATSLIAASVLAEITGGVLVDPQSGKAYPAGSVLTWAREEIAALERELR